MQGEINVERFMDYQSRQRRMLEWWYLKEYWRASDDDKLVVLGLYGTVLDQALEKCRRTHTMEKSKVLTVI